jgi:hypothetical protein
MVMGQVVADFENFGLSSGEFINNDTTGAGFAFECINLPNDFNESYQSWSGWAISANTDVTTPGFTNDLSSISGAGFDNSTSYAVAFTPGENVMRTTSNASGYAPAIVYEGMYVNNNTFAFLSMRDGDAFAKRFGGETGEDPDFFSIVFKPITFGIERQDSVEFFLADFRFENPDEDYILDEWTWVDLSSLGAMDELSITMRSSDVGDFGINTPLYFCADNVTTIKTPRPFTVELSLDFEIYPTLVDNSLTLDLEKAGDSEINIFSLSGELKQSHSNFGEHFQLEVGDLEAGFYFLQIIQDGEYGLQKFVKN